MAKAFQFAAIIGVVAFVQWIFSVEFDHDEVERIITTSLGLFAIEAASKKRNPYVHCACKKTNDDARPES